MNDPIVLKVGDKLMQSINHAEFIVTNIEKGNILTIKSISPSNCICLSSELIITGNSYIINKDNPT